MKNLIKNLPIIIFFLILISPFFVYTTAFALEVAPTSNCIKTPGSPAESDCTGCNQSSRRYYNCDGTTYLVPEDSYFDPTCNSLCVSTPTVTVIPTSPTVTPTPTPEFTWQEVTECVVEILTPTPSPTPTTFPSSSIACPKGYNLSGTIKGKPSDSSPITICLDPQENNCNTNYKSTFTNASGYYSIPSVSYADHSIRLQSNTLPNQFNISGPNPDNISQKQILDTCTFTYDFTIFNLSYTPAPSPTLIPSNQQCTALGNRCSGFDPSTANSSLKPCNTVSGICSLNWESCWKCAINATPVPTPTQAPAVGPGSSGSNATAPISPGQLIALNFRGVTLPGINPDVGSADLKLTFFKGDNTASLQQIPGGPFTANIARSQAKDTFSGRVVFPASALQLPASLQVYFIQISVGSYQAKISGDDGTKARTIAEIQSQQLSGLIPINIFTDGKDSIIPAVKLLSGDINGDGFIDGADLGILVACFGKKNVLTDSAGRTTDCSSKTQNRKFDADIDKNRSIDGIDINLWSRGANGII